MASYLRPTALSEALAELARRPCVLLAGGTDFYPARGRLTRDEDVLDITALAELRAIRITPEEIWIPALATWREIAEAPLPPACAGLQQAARAIGGEPVQNAATLIGNLCNASPAADGVPNCLALDATVELASQARRRRLALADFILGNRRTARAPDELVLGLSIPLSPHPTRGVFEKLGARAYLVISIVMVAVVARFLPDGRIAEARAAVGACGDRARRLPALEAALAGNRPDPALVASTHLAVLDPIDDVRASAAYRRIAALALLRRAVAALAPDREQPAA